MTDRCHLYRPFCRFPDHLASEDESRRQPERSGAAADMRGRGSHPSFETQKPTKVVMAAKRPDFRR